MYPWRNHPTIYWISHNTVTFSQNIVTIGARSAILVVCLRAFVPAAIFSSPPGANNVLLALGANTLAVTQMEIQSLQALGVTMVNLSIAFPALCQPFFTYNGDPDDYQKYLTFYRQVAAAIRAAGLRMVVNAGPVYTGVLTENSGLNVAAYYQTLTTSEYIAARTRQIVTIAEQIQPDYLVIAQEPDNEASMTGQPSLATAAGFSSMVDTFLTQLDQAGLTGTYAGAGIGTWLTGGPSFIKALAAKTRLNFIDLHVYPINAADPNIFIRDPFSFWAPLDQQFLGELVKLAWWKQLALVSPFWSEYFHAYLPYNAANAALPYNQLRNDEIQAFSTAVQNNQYTSTGLAWQSLIQPPVVLPALVSAANAQAGPVAPDSIVSIFGTNLATSTVSAAIPLPTVLAQTSLTFSSTVTCGTAVGTCTDAPIDLSSATDQVSLELFGTGIRGRGSLSDVRVSVGGILVTASYAGPQPQYPGMDQVNIPLPAALAGRGELNIDLSIAGHRANIVTIDVK